MAPCAQVRTVRAIGSERTAVKRRRHRYGFRECARRQQGIAAAHAVAHGGHSPAPDVARRGEIRQHGGGIAHDLRPVHRRNHRAEAVSLRPAGRDSHRIERLERGAVIEVGQRHDVAGVGKTLHHLPQLVPDAEGVHVDDHPGHGPAPWPSGWCT
jgi:hypothetical protein